jgi:HD-GYP domain-containing protein (c-di-GMP phosphodiesterase class II)
VVSTENTYRAKYLALHKEYLRLRQKHIQLTRQYTVSRKLFRQLLGNYNVIRKRYMIIQKHAGEAVKRYFDQVAKDHYELILGSDRRVLFVSETFLARVEMEKTEFEDSFYIDVLFDRYLPHAPDKAGSVRVEPFRFPVMLKDYGEGSVHVHPYHYFSVSGDLSYSKKYQEWVYRLKAEDVSASVELEYFQKTDKLITSLSRANNQLLVANKNVEMHKIIVMLLTCSLIEEYSRETSQHIERMRRISELLANECKQRGLINANGRDPDEYVKDIQYTSVLHDIGKMGVPRTILSKPARLTPEEYEVVKEHTVRGAGYIRRIIDHLSASPGYSSYLGFLDIPYAICLFHHERWDGKGYPLGKREEEIPMPARIVSVADTYDAIRGHRSYDVSRTHLQAMDIIKAESGKQFDPAVVGAFMAIEPLLADIRY